MVARLLVDTDVIIDYLRGTPSAVAYLENREELLSLSAITIADLYAGCAKDGSGESLPRLLALSKWCPSMAPSQKRVACFGGTTVKATARGSPIP
jgi:predicted nucleic acid-binding protein